MIPPCKDCPRRHIACYDTCPDFLAWREQHTAEMEHLRKMTTNVSVYCEDSSDRHRWQDKRRPLPFAVK